VSVKHEKKATIMALFVSIKYQFDCSIKPNSNCHFVYIKVVLLIAFHILKIEWGHQSFPAQN